MTRESDNEKAVGKRAVEHIRGGYHCAEAVTMAVLEALGEDSSQAVRHATPFGGGMGRSFDDTCGALTGGLIAIGHLHGRQRTGEAGREQGASWKEPARIAASLRDRFLAARGTTNCGVLREGFGLEADAYCPRLVEEMADAALDVLREAEGK